MKRSEINSIIDESIGFFRSMNFYLPPFAYFSYDEWKKNLSKATAIFDLKLGWDVTDFGSGRYDECGLLLFTVRNGLYQNKSYPKSYAEKIMISKPGQITPFHFHWTKMEDIINRGGGNLVFELYNATDNEELSDTPIQIEQDGFHKKINAGETLVLKPGESLTLPPFLYHKFYGSISPVMVGEVSMVNDDANDNRFLEAGRFPEIEEDVLPKYLLCSDYKKLLIS